MPTSAHHRLGDMCELVGMLIKRDADSPLGKDDAEQIRFADSRNRTELGH